MQLVLIGDENKINPLLSKYKLTATKFEIVHTFLETLYISNRLHLPLKGILLIGY